MHLPQIRARIIITSTMLLLGFIGIIFTDIFRDGAWQYWRILTLVYALLSLSLNVYLRQKGWKVTAVTLWHELAHWLGLLLCISLISFMVQLGLMSRFLASMQILVLLVLCTYLVGVYIEASFIPIGIVLGLFAAGIALFAEYLYAIIILLALVAVGAIAWMIRRGRKGAP